MNDNTLYGIWVNQINRFRTRLGTVTVFASQEVAERALVNFGYVNSTDASKKNTAYVAWVSPELLLKN